MAEEEKEKSLEKETVESPKEKKESKESKPAVEKETKKSSKKENKEEKVELERVYVVPLKKYILTVPQYKRAKKAIKVLKQFLAKHMKVEKRDLSKVKIDKYLNEEIWARGIKKPLNKVKVKAVKINGVVTATLEEIPKFVEYKMKRDEKSKEKAKSAKEKIKKSKEQSHDHEHDHTHEQTSEEKQDSKEKEKAAQELGIAENKEAAKEQKHTAKAKSAKEVKQSINRKALKR